MPDIPDKKARVLYIDDIKANLVLFKATFERDYEIILAGSGQKALDILKKEDIQVLVTDQRMPDMTGTELLEVVAQEYPDIRRFLLTAYTDFETVVEAVNKGHIHGYINKPIQADEVRRSINNSLEVYFLREKNKQIMADLERANEKLAGLDSVKTEMLKIMSHEIRTPLNSIMGTIHLLKDKIESEELINVINVMDTSVTRLERFSSMAEQISILKSPEHKLKIEKLSLKQLIEFSLVESNEIIHDKNITVDLQMTEDAFVHGEFDLLVSCLVNVLDHIILHSGVGGNIIITTSRKKQKVSCEIRGTGLEYPVNRLKEFSEHFSGKETSMDLKFGIELALAQLIMDVHKGLIIFSSPDEHSTDIRLVFQDQKD